MGNLPRWLETETDMPKHDARWTPLPVAACQQASPAGCFIRRQVFPCTRIKFRSSDQASSETYRWFLCQESSSYRSSSSEAQDPRCLASGLPLDSDRSSIFLGKTLVNFDGVQAGRAKPPAGRRCRMGPFISPTTFTLVPRPICLFALQVWLTPGLFGEPPRAPRDLGDCRFPVIMFAIKFEQAHKTKGKKKKIQLKCKFSPGRSKSYTGV